MSFIYTTAIRKIRALTGRKKIIQGSTSAGKTYGIIPVLIDRAIKEPRIKITVIAETIPAVKDGCVDIFKSVMQDTNRWIQDHWIGSPMEYTFSNGSRIQFKSFDSVGKAKAAGKRDILFINEGNHISYAIADTLMVRSKETYVDFNADEEFWAHTEVLKEPNSEFLALTYEDNEALPPEIKEELLIKRSKAFYNPELPRDRLYEESNIKSTFWSNWWRIYGLGEIGSYSERTIYSFSVVSNIPEDAIRIPSGMDFGSSPDPTMKMDIWYKDGELYCDEDFIQNNLLPEKIPGAEKDSIVDYMDSRIINQAMNNLSIELLEFDEEYYLNYNKKKYTDICDTIDSSRLKSEIKRIKSHLIVGDSSGKTELKDLKKHGYYVRGVKKGAGSVVLGMKRLKSFHINITKRSASTISAFRGWMYDVDDNGKIIPDPPKAHEPEPVVCMRYVAMARPVWQHLIPKVA